MGDRGIDCRRAVAPTTRAARAAASCNAVPGLGAILASGVWLLIGGTGPDAWRRMYLIGVLPALATFWIRRGIPESPK